MTSPKDGCSPSGQCGCCTVMLDGKAQVALPDPAGQGRRPQAVTTLEGLDAAERQRYAQAFAACGGLQCGFCIPGHRHAGQGAGGQEGRGLDPRGHGPPPRRPSVPLYRVRQDPRRHRDGGLRRRTSPSARPGGIGQPGDQVRGGGTGPGRQGLRGRPAGAGHAPRRPPARRPRPGRCRPHRHRRGPGRARRGGGLHGRRRPGRPAGRDHPQGLAGAHPRRRAHLLSSATCWPSWSPRPARPPEQAAELVDVDVRAAAAADRPDGGHGIDRGRRVGHRRATCSRAPPTPAATWTQPWPPAPTWCTRSSRPSGSSTPSSSPSRRLAVPRPDGGLHVYSGGQGVWDDRDQIAAVLGVPTGRRSASNWSPTAGPSAARRTWRTRPRRPWRPGSCGRPVKCTLSREESFLVHPKRHPMRLEYWAGCDARRAG